jgi:hypothetical protein
MSEATKAQQRRDRLREYEARLEAARDPVTVLAHLARARQARAAGEALESGFAETRTGPDAPALPASVWIALRQGDVDAVVATLVEHSSETFVVAEHEEHDSGYRLTAVPECRGLPDVDRLAAQVAAFVKVPPDVVAMLTGWGPDDPRMRAEVEQLMTQRFGPADAAAPAPSDQPAAPLAEPIAPAPSAGGQRARLTVSSSELAGVLSLSPEQQAVLGTLVRQADIVVRAG